MHSTSTAHASDYDVILLGGAFSGAATALLLKRELPELRVLMVERSGIFDRKVGESTSEVGACFLTRVLHMNPYLSAHHYQKHGLRMWFCQSEKDSVSDCTEIGPQFQSRLPTFQIDRAMLDQEVHDLAIQAGADCLRPATVREVTLADDEAGLHQVRLTLENGEEKTYSTRWVVDASGRAAFLAKKLGLHRTLGEEHPTSSVWCRFRRVNSLDSYESRRQHPALMQHVKASRSSATNHLMGKGWWVWLIPLSNGDYSVGIVWDRRFFDLPQGKNFTERLQAHVLSHPIGKLMLENAEPVEGDLFYYKGLPYYTEQMVGKRWAMVGDAAGFIDPLYSQGLDYCGHTVYAVTQLILGAMKGQDVTDKQAYLQGAYARSYMLWFRSLYKDKYLYMGDAELMRIAFIMDLGTYFIGPVRLVYLNPDYEWARLPYDGPMGNVFARFMSFYNKRLVAMARTRLEKGTYGAWNTGMDLTLNQSYSPNLRVNSFLRWGVRLWLMAEWRTWWARAKAKPAQEPAAEVVCGKMPSEAGI